LRIVPDTDYQEWDDLFYDPAVFDTKVMT
jgi:hypothetical protein